MPFLQGIFSAIQLVFVPLLGQSLLLFCCCFGYLLKLFAHAEEFISAWATKRKGEGERE